MATEYKRINLLIGNAASLGSVSEEGTPAIWSDTGYRLGWLADGAWKLAAVRGVSETFSALTVTGLPANTVPRVNSGKTLVSGSISDTGTAVTVSTPLLLPTLSNGSIPLVSTAGGQLGDSSLSEDAASVKSAKPVDVTGAIMASAGLGAHGVTPPTSRPTISGQRTATATLAALYDAIGDCGLIIDATTGTSVTREAIIQQLPITNSAPGTVTVVSGGMKSFGFDGDTITEELFYHCDVQHDYIAAGDMIFHVHWMPATATGGDVKWQIEYQWVETGATWPAPSTLTGTTAAGTTAWADKRTDITIPGAGRTYNSRIMIRLFRNPTDAADTYTGDAVLSSVGMHYQADPGQP